MIDVSKDGKSISRTYNSEEEMKNDTELQEFMGEHGMVMISTEGDDITIVDGGSKHIRIIESDEGEELVIMGDKANKKDSKVMRHENKVIMVEKAEGETVEVYSFTDEDDLPEDVRKMIKEKDIAVVTGDKADREIIIRKGNRVYSDAEGVIKNLDYTANLKKNEIRLSFEAEAAPIDIKLTDGKGKTLYEESLDDFDGSYEKTLKLNKIADRELFLTIEQEGKKRKERIDLK